MYKLNMQDCTHLGNFSGQDCPTHTDIPPFETTIDEDCLKVDRIEALTKTPTSLEQALCKDCFSLLALRIQAQTEEASSLVRQFEACADDLGPRLTEELAVLSETTQSELEAAEAELQALKGQEAMQEAQLMELQAELSELAAKQEAFWHRANEVELELMDYKDDSDEAKVRTKVLETELELLRDFNVLSELFDIE
jgi:chromosome segregation ATPase